MIEHYDFVVYAAQRDMRGYKSFEKIMDHSRLRERGGTVCKGPYSEGDRTSCLNFQLIDMDSLELVLRCLELVLHYSTAMKNDVIVSPAPPKSIKQLTHFLPILS
jgi:hypothetical protein